MTHFFFRQPFNFKGKLILTFKLINKFIGWTLYALHLHIPSLYNALQAMYKMTVHMEQQLVPNLSEGNHWQSVLV